MASSGTVLWLNRPAPFPKRFQSGDLKVDPPRRQYVSADLTVQKTGVLEGTIRIRSLEPLYGCTPILILTFRAKDGTVLDTRRHLCPGVNGTWLVHHPSDRVGSWKTELAPEHAARLDTIDFAAEAEGIPFIQRNGDTLNHLRKTIETYQETFKRGLGQ